MALSNSMTAKLKDLAARFEEVSALLANGEVVADRRQFASLSREFAELEPVTRRFQHFLKLEREWRESTALAEQGDDEELRELAAEEAASLARRMTAEEAALRASLLPKDAEDGANAFLEIRAGTGGDEAALFAGDLFRMYEKYAEGQGWRLEVLSRRAGEHGGYKELIAGVEGKDVYGKLKFESGVHRVQRVPQTESQGRIHTSACTVAVLPETAQIDHVEINKNELRIDTFRASGAGGQHVNKTDSAVRLTHLPSGIVVECQDERSQHKNKARALALLQARLLDSSRRRQQSERAESRRSLVGSGDRSERIRTYNFPQGRVTDHRINLTLHQLDQVLEGALEGILEALGQEHQADQLASLGEP